MLTPKILKDNPAVFIAVDILYRDVELLMDKPLSERRGVPSGAIGSPVEMKRWIESRSRLDDLTVPVRTHSRSLAAITVPCVRP